MDIRYQINQLNTDGGYWAQRIHSQLEYLSRLLPLHPECSVSSLEAVARTLLQRKHENGALIKADVLEAEQQLSCYGALAKSYRLHLVAHAHMDMDWMWGWHETVNIVIDTTRTMLSLLREYPDFIYSQSQASTYAILEQYAPELLSEVRRYVQEGRWEVLASTWTEHDKNMVNTESMVRQVLYAKQHLQRLFGLDAGQLQIDFEPDTFGHSRELPEMLLHSGIQYYYHCRGNDQEELYRWQASSGAELLVLRDPQWYYLRELDYHIACHVPQFCRKNHITAALRIYGVGDHGGGPSRQDIQRIRDMQTWPLLPTMEFSTLHRFFADAEQVREQLPVVNRELNYVFTGCYTAQSRLKQANRLGEDRLYDCEALSAMAKLAGCDTSHMSDTTLVWQGLLFNQFHDILPGSCSREAKERALGRFQDLCACSTTVAKQAMKLLGDKIATDSFLRTAAPFSGVGSAGHGYGSMPGNIGRPVYSVNMGNQAHGDVRVYTVYNPTMYERKEVMELTLWDWETSIESTAIYTPNGDQVPFDTAEYRVPYWQHHYTVLHVPVQIPAFGYCNYYVMGTSLPSEPQRYFTGPRVHDQTDTPLILENEYLKAVFSRKTMMLESLISKPDNTELITAPAAYFSLIEEQTVLPYSAWTVGREGYQEILNRTCFVQIEKETRGSVTRSITYQIAFRNSVLQVQISLPNHARTLRFSITINWQERATKDSSTPQLRFSVPFAYESDQTCYEIPGGHILRSPLAQDVPALRYAAPMSKKDQSVIFLTSDCKYGYRTTESTLSVNLLRSTVNPDPDPEHGSTTVELGLGVLEKADWMLLTEQAVRFAHPLYVYSNTIHHGAFPQCNSLLQINGRATVVGCKISEDKSGIILRFSQQDPTPSQISICTPTPISAEYVDLMEQPMTSIPSAEHGVDLDLPPYSIRSISGRCAFP